MSSKRFDRFSGMVVLAVSLRASVAAGLTYLFWWSGNHEHGRLGDIASMLASIDGTLLGFLIAAISLLIALPDNRLVSNMKVTGHYKELLQESFRGAVVLFLAMIASSTVLFVAEKSPFLIWIAAVAVFLNALAGTYAVSLGRKYTLVIRLV